MSEAEQSQDHRVGSVQGGPLKEWAHGLGLPLAGFRLLGRERSLWVLSAVPVGLTLILLALGLTWIVWNAGEVWHSIEGFWPSLEATRWYMWFWVGPVRLFFWLIGAFLFLLLSAAVAALSVLMASILASPFLDVLTRRVEKLVSGRVLDEVGPGVGGVLREAGRSMAAESARIGFLLIIWVGLTALGFLIPGAQLVTGPLLLGVTFLFLPLQFSGCILDRRQISFSVRRHWITQHWARMMGFGSAAFIFCFVPGLNLLVLPALVSAGTLLVLEIPPPSGGESASAESGEPL